MSRPVARPIAQIHAPRTSRSGPGYPEIRTPEDLAPARPSRISARALERVAANLSDLDIQVLGFVGEVRLATGKQLVRRFWLSGRDNHDAAARSGRRALKRLSEWRVLDPLPGRARGGTRGGSDTLIYGVGAAGRRLLVRQGRVQRLGTPGDRHISHTLTTTELVVRLHEADAANRLDCIEVQTEPACWRSFLGAMGARLICKPDLFIRVGAPGSAYESRWMAEVDLATESSSTIRSKALRHLDYYRSASQPAHPRVLWVVPDERRAAQLETVFQRLPVEAHLLFAVCCFEDALGLLITEARS